MADDVRQQIITTALAKRGDDGQFEETYVYHLKIWEEDDAGGKSRLLILSCGNGRGNLHKAKQNPSGSVSIGKTWKLEDVRVLEATDSNTIKITLNRSYTWTTERDREHMAFLIAAAQLHQRLCGNAPLQLVGFSLPSGNPSGMRLATDLYTNMLMDDDLSTGARPHTPTRFNGPPPSADGTPRRPVIRSPSEAQFSSYGSSRPPSPRDRPQGRPFPNPARVASPTPVTNASTIPPPPSFRPFNDNSPARLTEPARTPSRNRLQRNPSSDNVRPSLERDRARDRAKEREAEERAREREREAEELARERAREREREAEELVRERAREAEARAREREREREAEEQRERDVLRAAEEEMKRKKEEARERQERDRQQRERDQKERDRRYEEQQKARGRDQALNVSRNGNASRSGSQAPTLKASQSQGNLQVPSPPPVPTSSPTAKREQLVRVSFFDPQQQATADRLLFGNGKGIGALGAEDPAEATMANVEEMLEGIEWSYTGGYGGGVGKSGRKGAADMIEARLLDELMALEKANIHSFLESDDRVEVVMKYIDDSIKELDEMDGSISAYKVHLNAVSDDIQHIQGQDRGLQVQTQNQLALLHELEQVLKTVDVDQRALVALTNEHLDNDVGIGRLEQSAAELYKALMAGKESGMAAGMERLDEYRTHNAQFCNRMWGYLQIAFTYQANETLLNLEKLNDYGKGEKRLPVLRPHKELEEYLGKYCGLMLYLREMDEDKYSKICGAYFSTASDLHSKEMKAVFMSYATLIKTKPDDDGEISSFVPPVNPSAASRAGGTIRRAKGVVRSADRRDRTKDGDLYAFEASTLDAINLRMLDVIAPAMQREELFLADFLQITDSSLTFAEYMGLEPLICRKAAASAGEMRPATIKLIRGALDLIFGFLAEELRLWTDAALQRDPMQVVGILADFEQCAVQAEEKGHTFVRKTFSKQAQRMATIYNRHVEEQIRAVQQTKITTKKRKGVAHFIKYFPIYVDKIDGQLVGLEGLEVRNTVDAGYDTIIQTMFDSLQQMAKMDGAEAQASEDKGILNYHIILIENMYHFTTEMTHRELGVIASSIRRAQDLYDENLEAYVKLVLRKLFAKIMDFFDGVDRMLQTSAASDVAASGSFNKSALKRVVKEFNSKDIKKNVEALFKRVEKHFDDDGEVVNSSTLKVENGTVMEDVWRACEAHLARDTKRYLDIIGHCYGDTGVMLEYTVADVENAFRKHLSDDFDAMLKRSRAAGVRNMIITGGSLKESREAVNLAKKHGLFATTGCHPTRSSEFEKFGGGPDAYLVALDKAIQQSLKGPGRVVAVGECGLDYDRLHFAPAETQRKYFRVQLSLAKKHNLPLFLHSRAAHSDFVQILREEGFGEDGGRPLGGRGGVVHSFTGAKEEIAELVGMGFHLSVNGCGLKTEENLKAAAAIPLDKLLLETDAPWCSMTGSHASNAHLKTLPKPLFDAFFPASSKVFQEGKMLKGRNEPCVIGGVAWVMSRLKGVTLEEVTEAAWKNTLEVFALEEPLDMVVPAAPRAASPPPPPSMSLESFPALGLEVIDKGCSAYVPTGRPRVFGPGQAQVTPRNQAFVFLSPSLSHHSAITHPAHHRAFKASSATRTTAMAMTRDGLSGLKRSQLQKLCKQNHLRGNLKTTELVDLLVAHFEQQTRASVSERTTASPVTAATPQGSVHDENCQPSPNFVLEHNHHPSTHPTNILHLEPLDVLNLDVLPPNQLGQGSNTTLHRLNTLETLCTRLLTHATTATTIIADLKSRLDAAESSISNLTTTLEDTRTQLATANSHITTLRASAAATDQRITDSSSSMTTEIGRTQQLVQSVGSRLTQAQEKWHDSLLGRRTVVEPDNDNIFLFEPPAPPRSSSRSDRSRSKEPTCGSTVSWATHQQAIAGNLAPPAVRLFTTGTGGFAPPPHELDEAEDERPDTGSSSLRTRYPSVVPLFDSRSASVQPSSWSSGTSARKPGVGDIHPTQQADMSCNVVPLSAKAAGKRPASPIAIPTDPHLESYNARATKRTRHDSLQPQSHSDESSSLQSTSTVADSPNIPQSPIIPEPSTPPNRRTTLLLPPIEIVSTPSPSRSLRRQGGEYLYPESHGFATAPRPPKEGPTSPTMESPRRVMMTSKRKAQDTFEHRPPPPPPTKIDSAAKPLDLRTSLHATTGRRSVEPSLRVGPSSPATLLIGKGKAVNASVDPGIAIATAPSRASSLGVSVGQAVEEDVIMSDVMDTPIRSKTKTRPPYPFKKKPPGPPPSPVVPSNSHVRPRAGSTSSSRSYSFFAPPSAPKVEPPAGVATMLYPQSVLAPPPPPPHINHDNNTVASSSSSLAVLPTQPAPSLLSRSRWGASPGILPGDRPRAHPSGSNMLRDYAADPDEVIDGDVSPNKVGAGAGAESSSSASTVGHARSQSSGGTRRVSFWSQWTKDDGKASAVAGVDGDWTRMWGR
ncbi:hypothetical protein FRB96_000396 [Tulasnella sp. 330]|nr:hypothetical protein FRB96_000396 [Tulasnella sp. 330]